MIPYQFYVAQKCLRNRRETIKNNRFLSFLTSISIIGLAIGVAALIVVTSLINGFREEIHKSRVEQIPNIDIVRDNITKGEIEKVLGNIKNDVKIKTFIDSYGLISNSRNESGAAVKIRGVENKSEPGMEQSGSIMIGDQLANTLDVKRGDKVKISTLSEGETKEEEFKVSKIYHTGTNEFDAQTITGNVDDIRKLTSKTNSTQGVSITIISNQNQDAILSKLKKVYNQKQEVRTWEEEHIDIYKSIKTEEQLLYLNLGMIVFVSLFTILNTLFFVVNDKKSDIAIMKTLGVKNMDILIIFLTQGLTISLIGVISGIIIGLVVISNVFNISPFVEWVLNYQFIDLDLNSKSKLPFILNPHEALMIAGGSIIMSLLTVLYPCYKATRISPAEVLHYE